jgi:hypothetical protein
MMQDAACNSPDAKLPDDLKVASTLWRCLIGPQGIRASSIWLARSSAVVLTWPAFIPDLL